jgi:formylglycine-generating enzyme required for sulfatase activity
LPGWTRAYTPIYVELRTLVNAFTPVTDGCDSAEALPGLAELRNHLRNHLPLKPQDDDLIDGLFALLRQGRAALLLDGLDEVSQASVPGRQTQIHAFMNTLVEEFQQAPIIVTARPYAYDQQEWMIQGFGHTRLAPLDSQRQADFAQRLFEQLLRNDHTRHAGRETDAFVGALKHIPNDLRSNPLLLTLLAALWIRKATSERDLPSTRGELYRRAVDLLVKDWVTRKHEGYKLPLGEKDLLIVLEQVAFDAQARRRTKDEPALIMEGDIFRALQRIGQGRVAVDLLDHLAQQAGLLLEQVSGVLLNTYDKQYKFLHLSFQEYLAARELLYRPQDDRPPGLPLREARRFPDGLANYLITTPVLWANVLRLAVDELINRKRTEDAGKLLTRCCEPYRQGGDSRQAALLALQVALDAELFQKTPPIDVHDYQVLCEVAATALNDAGAERFTPEQRDIAGKLLGSDPSPGHDTRKGVGLRPDGLPDIAWEPIPDDGEFIYQKNERRTEPDFWIARYPITYAQYRAFLDAKDGFANPRWWRGLAAPEDHRRRLGEQRFPYWNHPAENVSWYDAVAFCRWLTAKVREHPGLLPPELGQSWKITLPTEWQWEKAARGHDGLQFPWGEKYISGNANINESYGNAGTHYLQKTSAVGMYPQGASPYGVMDMSGNVWEWCLNEFEKPERAREEGDANRVLRGGSWDPTIADASALARIHGWYGDRLDFLGFRVVVAAVVPFS